MPKISYGCHLFIVVSTMQSKQQQRGFSVGDFIDRGFLLWYIISGQGRKSGGARQQGQHLVWRHCKLQCLRLQ